MKTESSPQVYLLHFDQPFGHAKHYRGVALDGDVERRCGEHASGRGARLMEVIGQAGIGFVLARTWPGGRKRERQLKTQGGASRQCPICKAKAKAEKAAQGRFSF
jgi:predicted GIY-YIG superfamily endonuclease